MGAISHKDACSSFNSLERETLEREYPQLAHTTYLDHAGTTLYARSAIESFARDMTSNLYGNPHSASPSSALSTLVVQDVRQQVLGYLGADPAFFDVVFVANATAAIKLVAQAFCDQDAGFWYGYHKDAHTSLVGVREIAARGQRCFHSDEELYDWITHDAPHDEKCLRLLAFPAQSNMTGYRPPFLTWATQVREATSQHHGRTYTLLDAASFLTTGSLNLHDHTAAPDFVALSFYKIFGFPDLGALVFRKEAADVLLSRKYFGGGTVEMVLAIGSTWHQSHNEHAHEALEDGTLAFHNILALKHAMSVHHSLYGSPSTVSQYAALLSRHAYDVLSNLRHCNGRKVVHVYKDMNAKYGDARTQGPIISFNVLDASGKYIGKSRVEMLAMACGFQLRTGGLCNPGGIATMLDLRHWEMRRNFSCGMRCGDDLDVLGGKPTGVVRISLGAMTTNQDVRRFSEFLQFAFVCKRTDQANGLSKELDEKIEFANGRSNSRSVSVHNRSWDAPTITPVAGCRGIGIHGDSFTTMREAHAYYKTWDNEWYISDPITGAEIDIQQQQNKLQAVEINILPLEGKMVLIYMNGAQGYEDTSQTQTQISPLLQPTLIVDLWNTGPIPDSSLLNGCTSASPTILTQPVADQSDATNFFTTLLGFPATLSRRRAAGGEIAMLEDLKTRCVVWNCGRQHDTIEKLKLHNEEHARKFEDMWKRRSNAGVIPDRSSSKSRPERSAGCLLGLGALKRLLVGA